MNIPDLLNGILEATAAEASAKARVAALRAALEDEARRRLKADGAAPSWNAPNMGKVRLDPPGPWRATVADPVAWGSWVAEHHPTEAVALVWLEAPHLEDALDALRFAGIKPLDTAVEVRTAWATPFLESLPVDVTIVEGQEQDAPVDRTFTVFDPNGEVLDAGLTGARSAAKLVVSLDRARRRAALESAQADVTSLLAAAATEDAPAADLDVIAARRAELEAKPADYLAQVARVRGLTPSGTKHDLAERIARDEQASGVVVEAGAAIDPNAPTPDPLTVDELAQRRAAALVTQTGEPVADPGSSEALIARRAACLAAMHTAEDLKRACRARTLSVSGGKIALAERLAQFGVTADDDLTFTPSATL